MTRNIAEVVVAPGTRHWRAQFAPTFVANKPASAVLVVMYRRSDGRIGFDLDESGEAIFRDLVREGRTWSKNGWKSFTGGSATQYVRGIYAPGQQQPITVSGEQKPGLVDLDRACRLIGELASRDVDTETVAFNAGMGELAGSFERVCVHSIAQWETTIVATQGAIAIESLRTVCSDRSVGFRTVTEEKELPVW